jgi:hypothetical protein
VDFKRSEMTLVRAANTAIVRTIEATDDAYYEGVDDPEYRMLEDYYHELRSHSIDFTSSISSFVQTPARLFESCHADFVPSSKIWKSILVFPSLEIGTPPDPTWFHVRDTAWTLQVYRVEGWVTRDQWRMLYLLF